MVEFELSDEADVNPLLKSWKLSNSESPHIKRAKVSHCGSFIAVLDEDNLIVFTLKDFDYEEKISTSCTGFSWVDSERPTNGSKSISTDVCLIDKDNSINIHQFLENVEEKTVTSSLVNIVGNSIFLIDEGIISVSSVNLVTSNKLGDEYHFYCYVNGDTFTELSIPEAKEPKLLRHCNIFKCHQSESTTTFEERIKEVQYEKLYFFVISISNFLWIVSRKSLQVSQVINLYENLNFHDINHFGIIKRKLKYWGVFVDSENQIHFLWLSEIQDSSQIKQITSDYQGKTWKNRLSYYKRKTQNRIGKKLKDAAINITEWEHSGKYTKHSLKCFEKFQITFLHCSHESLLLLYNDDRSKYLVKYDFCDDEFIANELAVSDILATSSNQHYPILMVSLNQVKLPTFGASKEDLIDKIVKHSGIAAAEKFCRLNDWDQFSIPLHTLEIGLKHKQLETISFFLRSHTKVFTHYWKSLNEAGLSEKSSNKSFHSQKSHTDVIGSDELVSVIDMLIKEIHANADGAHKQAFLQDLLKISIDYFKNLIKDGVAALSLKSSTDSTIDSKSRTKSLASSMDSISFCFLYDIDESLKFLSSKLVHLQQYLQAPPSDSNSKRDDVNSGVDNVDGKTNKISMEEVNQYIADGNIGRAQKCFFGSDLEMGSFKGILSHARKVAMSFLLNNQAERAELILTNVGLDFLHEVRKIYRNTDEKRLRKYLHGLLHQRKFLSTKDAENHEFLEQLEELYSCDDFIEAAKRHSFNWDNTLHSKLLGDSSIQVQEENRSIQNNALVFNGCYSKLSINMISKWSENTREKVIIDGKFLSGAEKIFTEENSSALWEYLISRQDYEKVNEWITNKDSSFELDKLPDALITDDTTSYFEQKINIVLVKNGFYPQLLINDFAHFLNYLSETDLLFSETHPIYYYKKEITPDRRNELYFIFNNKFASFCVKNDLMLLLWHYVQHYSLSVEDFAEETLCLSTWFRFLLSFQKYIVSKDSESFFNLLVHNSYLKYSATKFKFSDLLDHDDPVTVLAIMLLCNLSKSQVFTREASGNPYYLEKDLFEKTLRKYPQLHASFFQESEQTVQDSVTFYQLLQDNTDLDCKRLFSWQSSNSLAVKDEGFVELPHFSHPYLVRKYGHEILLNHQYYLKQSRPFFAYLNYVQNDSKDASDSIQQDVYVIAMQNHNTVEIVSSCMMFLSMIDMDFEKIKVDAQTVNLICKYNIKKNATETLSNNFRQTIVHKIINGKLNDLIEILSLLEDAIDNLIHVTKVLRFSYKAVCHWRLAVRFSRIHNLPVSTRYIVSACKEENWLQIFLYIHMYQVPRKQVISAIESTMRNKKLMEHLVAIVKYTSETRVVSSEEKRRRRKLKEKEKEQKRKNQPPRDIRAQFYSRLGTVSSKETDNVQTGKENRRSSIKKNIEAVIGFSEDLESLNTLTAESQTEVAPSKANVRLPSDSEVPDDIINIILHCEEQKDVWMSLLSFAIATWHPLIPVVAACYEKSKSLDCICIWLFCGIEQQKRKSVINKLLNVQVNDEELKIAIHTHVWQMSDLMAISKCLIEDGVKYIRLLYQSFLIFRQGDILCYFLEFLNSFLNHEPMNNMVKLLERFQTEYARNKRKEYIGASLQQKDDLVFCEKYTYECLMTILKTLNRNMYVYELVKCLQLGKYAEGYSISTPDFRLIKESLSIIREAHVDWSYTKICLLDKDVIKKEIEDVVGLLLEKRYFEEATLLSKLHDLPECQILVNKIHDELKSLSDTTPWKDIQVRYSFWSSTDMTFANSECRKKVAAKFFQGEGLRSSTIYTFEEKALLLLLAMKWYQQYFNEENVNNNEQDILLDLEKNIWRFRIHSKIESSNNEMENTNFSKMIHLFDGLTIHVHDITCNDLLTDNTHEASELLQSTDETFLSDSNDTVSLLNEKEERGFELFISELLDKGKITEARKVSGYYQQTTIDFDIVMTAILLAQGYQSIDNINDNIKAILAQTTSRHVSISGILERSGSFTRPDSLQSSTTYLSNSMTDFVFIEETQTALEKLTLRVNHGKKICQQVLAAFKIASMIGSSYKEVVLDDHFVTLKKLLETGRDNRRQLSKQFIRAFHLNTDDVTTFISEMMISWTKLACGEELVSSISTFNYEPQLDPTYDDVVSLIQLTDNIAEVGNNIFQAAVDLSNNSRPVDRSSSNLQYEVELLILAHYCFTVSCDMDGIASILRAVRHCNATLSSHKEYKSMARLLLGIGRFRDTIDIIKSLYELQFFENLIKKDIPQEEELKRVLLNFLNKYHPEDTSTLNMILHGFGMYREIAENYERTAQKEIRLLKDHMKATITKDLMPASQAISRTFSYAADYYKKAGCYGLANNCSRLSRLADLQSQLIPSNICVLGLDKADVVRFICRHSNVVEALLVAAFYDMSGSNAWQDALYHQVICKGNFPYLQQFLLYKPLSSSISLAVAQKFRNEKNSSNVNNMKKFLRKVTDVKTKLKIAKELNFQDIEKEIMESPSAAYLRDHRF